MSWFKRSEKGIHTKTEEKKDIPKGLWYRTPTGKVIEAQELAENNYVSPEDDYHVHIGSKEYFEILFDNNEFRELDEKLKSKDWENTLHVDVNSHFYFTKKSIPLIKKSKNGSIINISSTAWILGFPLRSPYAASKWAIIGVTKTLAMELGKFNIRVNAVCPGTIKGDRMKRVIRDKSKFTKVSTKIIEKDFVSMSSMRQWILEEDIGKMCSFLISDDSSKVSGQVISVDGHTERND